MSLKHCCSVFVRRKAGRRKSPARRRIRPSLGCYRQQVHMKRLFGLEGHPSQFRAPNSRGNHSVRRRDPTRCTVEPARK